MPGYPKVDRESDFLISRFDGAILDAKPWGRAAPGQPPSAESLGYSGHQADTLTQLHGLEVMQLPCFWPLRKIKVPILSGSLSLTYGSVRMLIGFAILSQDSDSWGAALDCSNVASGVFVHLFST